VGICRLIEAGGPVPPPVEQSRPAASSPMIEATARIECAAAAPVMCLLEGGGTLLTVVPDGTRIARGETIARLETSQLDDDIRSQRIVLAGAKAKLEVARQGRVILEARLARELEAAQLAVTLATLDRQRYLEGEFKTGKQRLTQQVALAARRLELARDRLGRARKLADRGLLTPGQIDSDESSVDRAGRRSEESRRELRRFQTAKHRRRLLELDAALHEANERLTLARRDAGAGRKSHAAELDACQLDVRVADGRLQELGAQRRLATIIAPVDGVVLYPADGKDAGNRSTRKPGARVKKWQTVVLLADRLRPQLSVTVSGKAASKVGVGRQVTVRLPDGNGKSIVAAVSRVETVEGADPGSRRVTIPVPVLASPHWIGRKVQLRIDVHVLRRRPSVQTQPVTTGTIEGLVFERGRVERTDGLPVRSAVAGSAAVRRIAREGTSVSAGQTIVELDSTALLVRVRGQQVKLARTTAAVAAQQRKLSRTRSTIRRAIVAAKLEQESAALDLEEFENSRFVQARSILGSRINGLVDDRRRARERLAWSQRVLKKGYITRSTLESDRLVVADVENQLEDARGRLTLLVDHTRVRELKELKARLESARSEYIRVQREGDALVVQERVRTEALTEAERLEQGALTILEERVAACTITAARDGVVVSCADSVAAPDGENRRTVGAGSLVYRGQPLLVLAAAPGGQSNVRLTPARSDLVQAGQEARIRFFGTTAIEVPGHVSQVQTKGTSVAGAVAGDVVISIDKQEPATLPRPAPGQTAIVEVRVRRDDVLRVPSRAVMEDRAGTFCYVRTTKGIRRQPIRSGLRTREHVEVKSGVRKGDLVVTNPMTVDRGQLR